MDYSASDFLSALIGSAIGFTFGLVTYDLRLRREQQTVLRGLLLRIQRRIYQEGETSKVIDANYDAIVDACTGYEKCVYLFWNRRKFRRLFHKLVSHDPATLDRHCVGAYPERVEALRIIEALLVSSGHPRDRRAKQRNENKPAHGNR